MFLNQMLCFDYYHIVVLEFLVNLQISKTAGC